MQSLLVGRVLFVFGCLLHCASSQVNNTIKDLINGIVSEDYYELNSDPASNSVFLKSVESSVHFFLYTKERSDEGHKLVPGELDTLMSSGFDENKTTKIIIHGWLGNPDSVKSVCSILKTEYFLLDDDVNVVCVDWSDLSFASLYFVARFRCKEIGNYVAELILMLTNNTSQSMDNIHLIGFSMGAHIAGFAGKRIEGQVQRITGLDPARPMFSSKRPDDRLNENDAKFVDIIHTTNWLLGQHKPIGNIDFYPNGGNTKQPGCEWHYFLAYEEVCSHFKAYRFYARSIRFKDEFKSIKCNQWEDYKQSKCASYDDFTYLGEYANSSFSGNYYLSVT